MNFICKLKFYFAPFNLALYNGTVVKRETDGLFKLYSNSRCFSSKETFPKDKVIDKSQIKNSERQRGYRTGRDAYRQEDGEDRKWRASKSIFAAGTAKRTSEIMIKRAALVSKMEKIQLDDTKQRTRAENIKLPERPLTVAEWRKLKESEVNVHEFEITVMFRLSKSGADLDIAKSLLTFVVTETGTLCYRLMLSYLNHCVSAGHDSEVLDVYDIMRATFPSLETSASTLFIKSFCRTEKWREALVILQDLKKVFAPSSRNYGEIIAAAVNHNDLTTAWALYDELIKRRLIPNAETWEVLFTGAQKVENIEEGEKVMSHFEYEQRLVGLLHYMRDNNIYPPENLATSIKTWFESLDDKKWKGSWTSVSPKGICRCCGTVLESIHMTEQEYQELKDKVMINVIQGTDVFKKTTPEELERFKAFVKRKPAFDVVVDGLNVAYYMQIKSKLSEMLLAVVSELVHQRLTVLVLGRKHMLRPSRSWDKTNMWHIQQMAHCFFTDDISEDDPFLLYSSLHSGNHCQFVSRDLMRDHKACMPDGATKRLFFKWQRGHQLVIDRYLPEKRKVFFKGIPIYDTIIQTSGGSWHIPYDDSPDRSTYEVPQKWLCLTSQH